MAMDIQAWTPETWSAVGAWVTIALVAGSLLYAHRQVAEARDLRREQTRPYVVPSIGVEQQNMFLFVLENIGQTAAYDVRINFDQGPHSTLGDIENLRILHVPIPTMPPGHRYRACWDVSFNVLSDDYPHPTTYEVTLDYNDSHGRPCGPERFVLDFHTYDGQAVELRGINEIAKALEGIQRKL